VEELKRELDAAHHHIANLETDLAGLYKKLRKAQKRAACAAAARPTEHASLFREQVEALMDALRTYGYPVSETHWYHNSETMSREARALHLAAKFLDATLAE
jgi:hypothetical protein